jgi:hypothetical protein
MKEEGIIRVYANLSMDQRMIQAGFYPVNCYPGLSRKMPGEYLYDGCIKEKYSQDVPKNYALHYKLFSPDPSEDSMREQMRKEGYRPPTMVEALALFACLEWFPDIFLFNETYDISRSDDVVTGIGQKLVHRAQDEEDEDQYCTGKFLIDRTYIEKTFLFLCVKGH